MDDGSPRVPAARWVIGLGRLYWGLLLALAAWSLLAVAFTGAWVALAVPLLLAAYATVWGALVRAFAAHRRGSWWLLVGLTTMDLGGAVTGWLTGRSVSVLSLLWAAVHVTFLALLLHQDSKEWAGVDRPRQQPGARTGPHPDGRH